MNRSTVALAATIFCVSIAHAADLPADKTPEEKPKPRCYVSLMGWLNTSARDCPLTYGGFTLYGTIDVGVGYNTAGIPFGAYYAQGVFYGIQRASQEGRWSLAQNGQSQSVLGVKMEEPLGGDWLLIGAVEFGYNPYGLVLTNGPESLTKNNLDPLPNQIAGSDSSRAGQWDNSQGFVGISNKTYGTLTFGRVNSLSVDVVSAYDPVRSNAFSLLGFSGAIAGFGSTETGRVNTAFVYRVEYGNFRFGGLAQVGGYALGNGAMGQYQGQVGATFGGFSIDGVISYAIDAVGLSTYAGSGLPAGYDPNSILRATLSNNFGALVAARYKWNDWEAYGGWVYARLSNPSNGYPGGFDTIADGISVPPGSVTSNAYNVNRILNTFWIGVKYNIWKNLSVASGFYYQTQNNYLQAPAVCTGSGVNTSSNKCAGSQSAVSFLINYAPVKRIDLYAGMMVTNVYGGLASGFFKTENIDPTVGIRIRF